QISEHFPLMARMADRYAILRSVHHDSAPIHETGHQLMQTGRLFQGGLEFPHYGSVVSHLRGPRARGTPPFAILPGPIASTGVSVSHGQSAGFLGTEHDPVFPLRDTDDLVIRASGACQRPGTGVITDPARPGKSIVTALDQAECAVEQLAAEGRISAASEGAFASIFSPGSKTAVDVAREDDDLRKQYGM